MSNSRFRRFLAATALATTTLVATLAAPAAAHVSIVAYGTTFTAGSSNVIYFRVPHACSSTSVTNKVTVTIPASVTGVKPQVVPGWTVSRTLNGTTTATVTWTSSGRAYDLKDWQFMDFGIRATLNGVEGDVIVFDSTTQYCDFDESGNALGTPEVEAWTGVDAPKLTLVGTTKKVSGAADLADLKGRVVTLESTISAMQTTLTSMATNVGLVVNEMQTGQKSASISRNARGVVFYDLDLSTIWKKKSVDIMVGSTKIGSVYLNSVGDASGSIAARSATSATVGSTVSFVWKGVTVATGVVI